jgi:hypothetical protein
MGKVTCENCEHARQVGDKNVQNIVGCVRLIMGDIKPRDVRNSNVYEGYVYGQRRVGDTAESEVLGKGVLTFGLMTDCTGTCHMANKST